MPNSVIKANQGSGSQTERSAFIVNLAKIVGKGHVLSKPSATLRFRKGFRQGLGDVIAVVRPGSLVEQWRVLKACVEADKIVIMQGANTGLTGGSTPDGNDYDRGIVIISTLRMTTIQLLGGGKQVVCLPGVTLHVLEDVLGKVGREPHSVIGSSCIGASVFGGVSNNSGGALVQRGPAYTEMAIFAQVDEQGRLNLTNHLGIRLGNDPEEILAKLEGRRYLDSDVTWDAAKGHDGDYVNHVREIDANTPARFNADSRRWHEGAGCAGRLALFAVRLDTFPASKGDKVFYIGTNKTAELEELRRHLLTGFDEIPISGEYLHREAFDVAAKYGKDTFIIINLLGTKFLPSLFALRAKVDGIAARFRLLPSNPSDRLLQLFSNLCPSPLPKRMRAYRKEYEHHLMLKVSGSLEKPVANYLEQYFSKATGSFFECAQKEGDKAFLHRFAAAGAAVRYRAVHTKTVANIVPLDVALRRNDRDWFEQLPREITDKLLYKLYYGHFLCHVMHQDYVVKKGFDTNQIEASMLALLDKRGARYPAEHNVGHLYNASDEMKQHYRKLDPCNCFNPGIGKTSKKARWLAEAVS